jgi:hypothetical protein
MLFRLFVLIYNVERSGNGETSDEEAYAELVSSDNDKNGMVWCFCI